MDDIRNKITKAFEAARRLGVTGVVRSKAHILKTSIVKDVKNNFTPQEICAAHYSGLARQHFDAAANALIDDALKIPDIANKPGKASINFRSYDLGTIPKRDITQADYAGAVSAAVALMNKEDLEKLPKKSKGFAAGR